MVKDTVLVPVKFPVPVIVKEAVPALVLLVKLTVQSVVSVIVELLKVTVGDIVIALPVQV